MNYSTTRTRIEKKDGIALKSPLPITILLFDALRVLDGRLAGASYRAIAEDIYGPSRIAAESWKTSALRDTVIRLARTGFNMMSGDYRKLLRPRQPD